jgi:CheY-like chemotaxis protein
MSTTVARKRNRYTDCHEGKTVLIVDDHPWICELISQQLIDLGYHTLTAENGKEAQNVIQQQGIANIDLLVTDLHMPRMSGDELAEWFLDLNPLGQVLMISSDPDGATLCKFGSYLQKPFFPPVFGLLVDRLLANAQGHHSKYAE